MKVKIFEWATSTERDAVEEQLNALLTGGCKIVNILQSSTPSHVSMSVWYELAVAQLTKEMAEQVLAQNVQEITWSAGDRLDCRILNGFDLAGVTTVRSLVEKCSVARLRKTKRFGPKGMAAQLSKHSGQWACHHFAGSVDFVNVSHVARIYSRHFFLFRIQIGDNFLSYLTSYLTQAIA